MKTLIKFMTVITFLFMPYILSGTFNIGRDNAVTGVSATILADVILWFLYGIVITLIDISEKLGDKKK